tara:strand:- start:19144 stop:19317 length:174 start_codon:yes stop_codon:yes gene_type:complete
MTLAACKPLRKAAKPEVFAPTNRQLAFDFAYAEAILRAELGSQILDEPIVLPRASAV